MSVVLSEHLPLLASAPDGIQKLRGLILELAVRGKLVPQDSDDESASELLKRIAQERVRLDAAATRRKSKETPTERNNSPRLDLPSGWECAPLGEVVEIVRGITFPSSEKSKSPEPGRVLCLRTSNVQDKIEWDDVLYIRSEFISRNDQYVIENDIVMSMANSRELVGKVALVDVPLVEQVTFGGFLGVLRPISISPKFLMAFLRAPTVRSSLIDSASQTTNIANISLGKLRPLEFPIPPLAEQHRIVAKVDELMALCDRLEAEQADAASAHARLVETLLGTLTRRADTADFAANWQRLAEYFETLFTTEASIDALKQTVLQLAVMGKLVPQNPADEPANELLKRIAGERARLEAEGICKKFKAMPSVGNDERPFEVPEGWIWERVGNYVIQTDYGLSEKTFAATDGVPVLKMGDIQGGNVVLGGQKAVPPTTEGLPYLFLEPDDLLYNRTNSAELVGKTGIFRGPAQQYSFASYLIRIRCANGMVSPTFLNFAMNAPMFRETEIVPHLKQQCGQANVNGTILRSMRIPVPPAAEQHRIVAKVDELMAICERLKADLGTARQRQATLAETLIESALEAA